MTILGARPGVALNIASLVTGASAENKPVEVNSVFSPPLSFSFLAPPRAQGSSFLDRRAQMWVSPVTSNQFQIDQFSKTFVEDVQSPWAFALVAGAGTLVRSAQWGLNIERTGYFFKNFAASMSLKNAGIATLPFGLVACSGADDSNGPFRVGKADAGPDLLSDGGIKLDSDQDGVPVGLDCDDQDPNTFPLVGEPRTIELRQSTKICPGVYNGFSLRVPNGTKDIQVIGEGVILDGRVGGNAMATSALRVINGDNIELSGFRILYYNEPVGVVGMVTVEASRNVQLYDLNITGNKGNWPVRISNSDDTTLEKVLTYTHSDRGIFLENSKRTTIKDSRFNSEKPYDYGAPAYALVYVEGGANNTLIGCHMFTGQAKGLYVKNSLGFQGIEMVISGNGDSGMYLEDARGGFYRDSNINNNLGYGLYILRNTRNNTFSKNNFTSNAMGPYGARDVDPTDAPLSANTFLNNTPQP